MKPYPRMTGRGRLALLVTSAVTGLLIAGTLPAQSQPAAPTPSGEVSIMGEGEDRVADLDARTGHVTPTAAQKSAADALGATAVRWNDFGTPHVLINHGGYLSEARDGKAVDVARGFVRDHRGLFRLDDAAVDSLEVLRDSPLYDAPDLTKARDGEQVANPDVAHVVMFRQTFGDLEAGLDGLLTVGVQRDGRVAWVSSSVTGDDAVTGSRALSAAEAIGKAADNAGLDLGDLSPVDAAGPWTTFSSTVVGDVQRARLMALPTPTDGVRRAWEVTLLKGDHTDHPDQGQPAAFITFVDAETGKVLVRTNKVDHLVDGGLRRGGAAPARAVAAAPSGSEFSGATSDAGACTPAEERHGPFTVDEGNGQITVTVGTTMPNGLDDDITVNLYAAGTETPVAAQDLLTSPEALTYAPDGGVPAGDYFVEVCEFTPATGSIGYAGLFSAHPMEDAETSMPRWRVFPANPNFTDSADPDADTRQLWCWADDAACDEDVSNGASRVPWDVQAPSLATHTTDGNNATTAISEVSFLTPDTVIQRPFSPDRNYDFPWQNTWFNSSCDPATFDQPGGNDDDASTANLFVMHNRMHDWSYYLGFTETNSNLQQTNFGNTGTAREHDPEVGNAQAGRRTFNGRDNANQITLQDGIAPITNQYLWQSLAGAFYTTCTDGAYDMAVVAHEYGHAISNRMVGGPDTGTGSTQGQTESWSDLIFSEYFRGFGITAGESANPFALGPYVAANKQRGIRNYGMNDSPLNYSDLEYDGNGTGSPHADGEIWSATNFSIAEALNAKYDDRFPSSDEQLQLACAQGELPARECPGNRRWAQIMFDGLLLTPSGSTMLDSRDAMLAADMLRFDGANQSELWNVFASRGMGETASSTGADDRDPVVGWSSPESTDEATITFAPGDSGAGVPEEMTVYTGVYEARISPTADTVAPAEGAEDVVTDTVEFVPGTYEFIARADGFGAVRFTETFEAGETRTVEVPMRRNLASKTNGAVATGDGVNLEALVDDTEATNWASLESAGTASEGNGEGQQVQGRQVTVQLADTPVDVSEVKVSAALRPTDAENADSGSQSRFSALRSFDILACDATDGGNTCGSDEAEFDIIYRSADDAFPGVKPRPVAPDLTLREFDVTDTTATHIRIRVRDNQCTGGPQYQGAANPMNDPVFSNPDCDSTEATPDREVLSPPYDQVRIAELQVYGPECDRTKKGKCKGGTS